MSKITVFMVVSMFCAITLSGCKGQARNRTYQVDVQIPVGPVSIPVSFKVDSKAVKEVKK